MRIRVVHETIYTYEQPARGLVQVLRLTPRDHDGQYVRGWRIDTTVDGRLTAREDGFGNVVHWFTPDEPADALTIRVTGEVDTDDTHGVVRGTVPERLVAGPHEGIEGDEGLHALLAGIADRFAQFRATEVQSGEIAGIGLVAETAIDGIGAGIDGLAERGRGARRTNQFHVVDFPSSACLRMYRAVPVTIGANGPARAPSSSGRSIMS